MYTKLTGIMIFDYLLMMLTNAFVLMMLKSIKKTNYSSIVMWSSSANISEELLTMFIVIGQTPMFCKIRVLLWCFVLPM